MKESAHPEHYAARRLGYRKEGSYIPGEIEKLIKTIKVMYKFEQQLHDKIEVLKRSKENKEKVLSTYIDKKSDPQYMNKLNVKIIYLHDKINLLERIMYDYKNFQDKIHYYVDTFVNEAVAIGTGIEKKGTESFFSEIIAK